MNIDRLQEPYVLVLIGPPLVGKSTWIKKNFGDKKIKIISRDQILLDQHHNDDYGQAFKTVNQKKVNAILNQQLQEAADSGENAIIDMTNLVSKRRRSTLDYFGDEYNKIAVIFPIVSWEDLMKRNEKRREEEKKFIPEPVLKSMLAMYQPIRKEEGFSKVVSI